MASRETMVVTTRSICSKGTPKKYSTNDTMNNIVCINKDSVEPIKRVAFSATFSTLSSDLFFNLLIITSFIIHLISDIIQPLWKQQYKSPN